MSVKRIGVIVGVVAALTLTALPAIAQTDEVPERHRPRVDRFCEHIPEHTERIEQRLARIQGDAGTRGSIEWLAAKQAEAEDAGRDNLAVMIGHRIAIKTEIVDVLEARLAALGDAEVFCEDRPTTSAVHRRYY